MELNTFSVHREKMKGKARTQVTFDEDYNLPDYKPDFSDLEERLNYYIEHVDESLEIIRHAHEYVSQFKDKRRENLISLLVLDKYFKMTGQKS